MSKAGITIGSTGAASGMRLHSWKPSAALRPFVDHFAVLSASLDDTPIYDPLPARNDCFLEFFLQGALHVVNVASGAIHTAPRCVVVGPQTGRREDIILSGTLKIFHIGFTPTGFHSLFAIPTCRISNSAESAEAVLGSSVRQLEERLQTAPEQRWGVVAEHFLMHRLTQSKTAESGALAADIARVLASPTNASIADLASIYGRTTRQIERTFENQIGVSPKLFSRVSRLRAALQLSTQAVEPDWSAVAADAGYFDQSHMIRDFRALTGETPAGFRLLQSGRTRPELRSNVAFVQSSHSTGE